MIAYHLKNKNLRAIFDIQLDLKKKKKVLSIMKASWS